jgi:hypothetical protein
MIALLLAVLPFQNPATVDQKATAYFSRLAANEQRILAAGSGSYLEVLRSVYGAAVDEEIRSAVAYRVQHSEVRYLAQMTPDALNRTVEVLVDPYLAKGVNGYIVHSPGAAQVGIEPPSGPFRFDPVRPVVTMDHELTHQTQLVQLLREPVCLERYLAEVRKNDDQDPVAYLLDPKELEVRLADLNRLHFLVAGRGIRLPSEAVEALCCLGFQPDGGKGVTHQGLRPTERMTDRDRERLRRLFPDAVDLLAILDERELRRYGANRAEVLGALSAVAPGLR